MILAKDGMGNQENPNDPQNDWRIPSNWSGYVTWCKRHNALTPHTVKGGNCLYCKPTKNCWNGMNARCHNPKDKDYQDYGGRGIVVCERWRDYDNFVADMGPRPSRNHSIDRIASDGNYEPSNCRWATKLVQQRNKRNNVLLTARGETKPRAEWAELSGINISTLVNRLRRGWSHEEAIFTPILQKNMPLDVARERKKNILSLFASNFTGAEIAAKLGITKSAVTNVLGKARRAGECGKSSARVGYIKKHLPRNKP